MRVSLAEFAGMVEASNALFCLRQRTTRLEPLALAKQCQKDVYGVYAGLEQGCSSLEERTVMAVITKVLETAHENIKKRSR
ncbi:hypothetical protein F404_gp119 [Vibrio phage pVp-1]|uniref:Uncharacterized protein n=1 Tax=Vibrio phage pVp-1 TaxID=1150989 RepID=H6WXL0_9CAUD|nr:hypothetical protein F404_gp119 [Vibrio phage pVp-1]AFB83976.1 hypothetical protein pVp-1_0119 [Vibrio phage pVp-1]